MSKQRKRLDTILSEFEDNTNSTPQTPVDESNSLTAQLANPKRKSSKIRFTLDLEKSLDDRLNKAAKFLNRSKADITRIAISRLLDELDNEKAK
jgi:hypothetical protein